MKFCVGLFCFVAYGLGLGQAADGLSKRPQLRVEQLVGEGGFELHTTYTAWHDTAADDIQLVPEISMDLRTWRPIINQFVSTTKHYVWVPVQSSAICKDNPQPKTIRPFFRLRIQKR